MKKLFHSGHTQSDTDSAAFRVGDSVRVKEGECYPDVPDIDISGWQGRITDIDPMNDALPVVGLAWDSIALRSLPAWLIEESVEKGLDWSEIYLETTALEHAPARDCADDVRQTLGKLEALYRWSFLGEQGSRIHALLANLAANDTMGQLLTWERHLGATLKFPFEAKVVEFQERDWLRTGDILQVLGLEIVDDFYGIIVHCRRRETLDVPLADLECTDKQSANYDLVTDYAVWFANR